jgi:hypothetical protein
MTVKRRVLGLSLLTFLTLSACASQPYIPIEGAPGFLHGFLHGFIAWFALIGHIFDHNIRIYAYPNNGGWYDFGFLLGACIWGGGAGAGATARN